MVTTCQEKFVPIQLVLVWLGMAWYEFGFSASFVDAPAKGVYSSCCEVRQDIRWSSAVHEANSGPLHSGFLPPNDKPDQWNEDVDQGGQGYGYRESDDPRHSGGDSDDYEDGGYHGADYPRIPIKTGGGKGVQFRLRVIDKCNGGRDVQTSAVISLSGHEGI